MANFLKAVEWMKKGKKVRRKCWGMKDDYWYLKYPDEVHSDIMGHHLGEKRKNKIVNYFSPDLFQAQDWQIYKEEK